MLESALQPLLFIILIFSIVFVISYTPAIWLKAKVHRTQRKLAELISKLPELYDKCRIVITERLGEGAYEEKTITFEIVKVQKKL